MCAVPKETGLENHAQLKPLVVYVPQFRAKLTPCCRQHQFVAYDLAWATEGDDFSSMDFWGSLLGQLCTISN
jgi:hypothetical protein